MTTNWHIIALTLVLFFHATAGTNAGYDRPSNEAMKKLSGAISGTYNLLKATGNAADRRCPKQIKLRARVVHNSLEVPLPSGLLDPSNSFHTTIDGKLPSLVLTEGSKVREGMALQVLEKPTVAIPRAMRGKLTAGALVCPLHPENPFVDVSLTPLNRYIVPILVQRARALGLSSGTINLVFASHDQLSSTAAADPALMEARTQIRAALAHLAGDFVLSLNRKEAVFADNEEKLSSCVLRGGALSAVETEANMNAFLDGIYAMVKDAFLPLPRVSGMRFWPTSSSCDFSVLDATHKTNEMRILGKSDGRADREYGVSPLYTTSFRGNECARLELYRYPETEKMLALTPHGRSVQALAKELMVFIAERLKAAARERRGAPTFSSYFPAFSSKLQNLALLSNMFVGRISFEGCQTWRPAVDFLLVKRPVTFFFCNGFSPFSKPVENVCRGDDLEKTFGIQAIVRESAVGAGFTEVLESILDYTLFMPRHSKCVYSSSRTSAARLKTAFEIPLELQMTKTAM